MENCVHQMYKYSGLVEKFDFVIVQNRENSRENCVHQMYRSFEFVKNKIQMCRSFEFDDRIKS